MRQQEETGAWQRCRPFVLREGDRNTTYFHAKAALRRKRNRIKMLEDSEGFKHRSREGLHKVVTDYFAQLFSTSRPEITIDMVDFIHQRLSEDMIAHLSRPYIREEVEVALADMHPGKSPGPDGLPAMFYKKFWDLIGDDVCEVVLNFLNNGFLPKEINFTHVALIPKTKTPSKMTELRPISLCNVSYKLISKTLANRLKMILPSIIDETQSDFVPGRLITNNILLSSEVFHFMRHSQAKKRGIMALKLDMSKAYDRIEWDYLACMLIRMGFPAIFVDRVMQCVTTVKYAFLINGEVSDVLVPSRGLRQGDPSPYLFLICAEGLGALIKKAHEDRFIHGVSIARNAPVLTHLFFADDSMIFGRASVREAVATLGILKHYETLSGQIVNMARVRYLLVNDYLVKSKVVLVRFWALKKFLVMINILGSLLYSKDQKRLLFWILRRGFGKN